MCYSMSDFENQTLVFPKAPQSYRVRVPLTPCSCSTRRQLQTAPSREYKLSHILFGIQEDRIPFPLVITGLHLWWSMFLESQATTPLRGTEYPWRLPTSEQEINKSEVSSAATLSVRFTASSGAWKSLTGSGHSSLTEDIQPHLRVDVSEHLPIKVGLKSWLMQRAIQDRVPNPSLPWLLVSSNLICEWRLRMNLKEF